MDTLNGNPKSVMNVQVISALTGHIQSIAQDLHEEAAQQKMKLKTDFGLVKQGEYFCLIRFTYPYQYRQIRFLEAITN